MKSFSSHNLTIEERERLLQLAKATKLKRNSSTAFPITAIERSERLPLSFAQQRLWFLAQMEGVSQAYHISSGLRLFGALDRDALRRALNHILARHEALRATFIQIDGEPWVGRQEAGRQEAVTAFCHPASCRPTQGFHLLEHDLRAEGELNPLIAEETLTPFDLENGPLIRGRLVRLAQDEHVLLVTMHHIVSDGWSMGILMRELGALYNAFLHGEPAPLPELPVQYPDYAVWQRRWLTGEVLEAQAEYWKNTLAGAPAVLELPADHPRPAQQDFAGAAVEFVLDARLSSALKALSRRHGTTLFMTLLAGWAALLARLSGQEDLVIGAPIANRNRVEIEPLIGFFVNTLALRLEVPGSATVEDLLHRVKTQVLAAQQHQDIPFEQVVELAQPARSLAHSPLFQVMFAWQNTGPKSIELYGLRLAPLATPHVTSKFDLTLSLAEAGEMIAGGVEYASALFERATIERYLEYLRTLLEAMTADDAQAIAHLPLLGEAERRQVLIDWNSTVAGYPQEKCVHQLFETQAERTPDAIAVAHEDRQLSYSELNARANRLAHYLREIGVGPDSRVALYLERSPEMVVGLLAVLKTGAAYVPLDISYPSERLAFAINDCEAKAVLAVKAMAFGPLPGVQRIDLDDLRLNEALSDNPDLSLDSRDAAYVIYTSGSTGQPKGVVVPHRAIGRLVLNNGYAQFGA